ncbi:hypothetical protein NSMS1_67090 (plasmid) [Nostoc sp. MS1]|nr:hypothetical protein NSMS1_67090 [Nostoc sp. MS1]
MGIISRISKKYYPGNIRKNVGGVGGELVVSPTAEKHTRKGLERKVGDIGGSATTFSDGKSTLIDINLDTLKVVIEKITTNSTNKMVKST